MKKHIIVMLALVLNGCGEATPTAPANNEASAPTKTEQTPKWYEDDLSTPVENVGFDDPKSIMASAKLKPVKTEKDKDPRGETETRYTFSNNSLNAQLEHSRNFINISWYQASDSPTALPQSNESLKQAYLLARAMMGEQGKEAVRHLSKGGTYKGDMVAGVKLNGNCVSSMCLLTITR